MTTINNLPDEFPWQVFKKLEDDVDSLQCQQVCQSWLPSARVAYVSNASLSGQDQLEQFISFIDQNQTPLYLNAIKNLDIFCMSDYEAIAEIIKKLFFRFLNLAHVTIWYSLDFLTNFNNEICKQLLNNCQKLKTFELICHEFSDDTPYHEALQEIRLLVTSINLRKHYTLPILEHYLCRFPHLTSIYSWSSQLNNFQHFLPVILQCPNLLSVSINKAQSDKEQFMDKK